jgi:hypothetical protein
MAPTASIQALLSSIGDVLFENGVTEAVVEQIRPQLTSLIENFASRLDTFEKLLAEQKTQNDELHKRVSYLERQVKRSGISEKKRDVALVRHNVIIRSNSSIKDIKIFLSNCMELGGWGSKVPPGNISIVELTPPQGKARDTKVFRVVLQEGQKSALFGGLQKGALGPESAIKIDNETPLFASHAKRSLEQLSFSLRQKFGRSDKIRIKLVLNNLRLKMRLRDATCKDSRDWFSPEDERAAKYFDSTNVIFRENEAPAKIPSCRQFYIQILKDQE